jgi:hypothetical protein
MKPKPFLFCCAALAALLTYACVYDPLAPTTVNVNVTQHQSATATPAPTTPAGCNPVATVGTTVPESVKVGEAVTLDATAKDAAGNTRSDACNVATGVVWTVSGPCSLSSSTSFTPRLRGDAVGQCAVSAQMGGVTSAVKSIRVLS